MVPDWVLHTRCLKASKVRSDGGLSPFVVGTFGLCELRVALGVARTSSGFLTTDLGAGSDGGISIIWLQLSKRVNYPSETAIEVCWLAMNNITSSTILLSEHHHSTRSHVEVDERETYTNSLLYIPL